MAHANSTKFALDEAQKLAEPLPEPPRPLTSDALRFWPTVVDSKRRSAWTQSDLTIACSLCRDLALIEKLADELEQDGPTLETKEGRRYPHPAGTLLDAAQRRVLATTRSLQIHAIATAGKSDHQGAKNEAARQLAGKLAVVSDLIPKASRMN